MIIHPAFDPETLTWFHDDLEAKTLAELKGMLPPRTKIKGYAPTKNPVKINVPVAGSEQSSFVLRRGSAYGVNGIKPPPAGRRKIIGHGVKKEWDANEVAYLRENYGKLSPKKIAEKLGRNRNSVIGKANRVGLAVAKKPSGWT